MIKNILKFMDRRPIAFCHDIVMVILAWLFSYEVHQNLALLPKTTFLHAISLLPIVLSTQVGFFIFFGLYRGVWRFASLPDLIRIIKSILCGVVTLTLFAHFFLQNDHT